jgi:hypothetical protein
VAHLPFSGVDYEPPPPKSRGKTGAPPITLPTGPLPNSGPVRNPIDLAKPDRATARGSPQLIVTLPREDLLSGRRVVALWEVDGVPHPTLMRFGARPAIPETSQDEPAACCPSHSHSEVLPGRLGEPLDEIVRNGPAYREGDAALGRLEAGSGDVVGERRDGTG